MNIWKIIYVNDTKIWLIIAVIHNILRSSNIWCSYALKWMRHILRVQCFVAHRYELLTKRDVKMTGSWPSFFSCVIKDRGQYPAILTSRSVNKGFIIWKSVLLHDRCNEECSSGKLLQLFSNKLNWCLLSAVSSNQLTRTKTAGA